MTEVTPEDKVAAEFLHKFGYWVALYKTMNLMCHLRSGIPSSRMSDYERENFLFWIRVRAIIYRHAP